MKNLNNSIAYAQNFLSFLFLEKKADKIEKIYLFGSAARNEMHKESDIDIFLESKDEIEITSSINKFYRSKDYEKWKYLNFTPKISVKTGRLDEWELKDSILSDGILLYSKIAAEIKGGKKVIITFEFPQKKKHYLKFTRTLFGRNEKNFKDIGILEKLKGEKIGSNSIIVPKENLKEFLKVFHELKVEYKLKEIVEF